MATFKDNAHIGEQVNIELGGMKILVQVVDFKVSYGKKRWQVAPVQGSGSMWIENLKFD